MTSAPALLCMLVVNHTCALIEAAERGLDCLLAAAFPIGTPLEDELVAAITYCDLSVGPTGAATTPQERIDEILARYREGDPVHRAISTARPRLLRQYRRVEVLQAMSGPA